MLIFMIHKCLDNGHGTITASQRVSNNDGCTCICPRHNGINVFMQYYD